MLSKKMFHSPDKSYRGKPFWTWNGKLNNNELLRQISIFKDMGMGGYFCHSRTGLQTQYLSDEWFSLINDCADFGHKNEMKTWIYDEDRWPSGTAGGFVTEKEENQLKFIRVNRLDSKDFSCDKTSQNVFAVFSLDMENMHFDNAKCLKTGEKPTGNTVLVFSIEPMERSSFYNGATYVDTMNRSATETFIELTHEKYKQQCGERIGDKIAGIFTDEPHRGALMCGFGIDNKDAENLAPYTEDLFSEFQKRFGYDLKEKLPELFYFVKGNDFSKVKYQYVELLQELFIERYLTPINDWCKKANLKLTGHMLHEDNLAAQVCMQGSLMRSYEYMDIPGMDLLTSENENYWIAKQVVSVARQQGKEWVLSELYGNTGWHLTFNDHKNIGDWQALFGINLRCHHLSWYTMQGEAKRDYPASIFYQSCWYRYYKYVEDYFARINYFQMQGTPICDVLVVNPVESIWGMVYPGWASNELVSCDKNVSELEEIYKNVFMTLSGAQIDFDYGDEAQMGRMAFVENGKIKIGNAGYSTVILPGMKTIRSSTLALISELKKQGGKVIFVKDLPQYVDASNCDKLFENDLSDNLVETTNEILKKFNLSAPLKIKAKGNKRTNKIFLQARKYENSIQYMLLNTDKKNEICVTLQARPYKFLELWDARNGNAVLLTDDANEEIELTISAGGEVLLVATEKDNGYSKRENLKLISSFSPQEKSFEFKLTEPNVCVLDKVGFELENGESGDFDDVLRTDNKLREIFNLKLRTGTMCQPWYNEKFGKCQEVKAENNLVLLKYPFNVKYIPSEIMLAVETPEQFELFVNGSKINQIIENEGWVDPCFTLLRIPSSILNMGKNEVTIKHLFTEKSNIEALYLLGDFGVSTDKSDVIITELPSKLKSGDICDQGLKFYGGGLCYYLKCPQIKKGERLFINLSESHSACYVVRDFSGNEKIIAFEPFNADITEFAGKEVEIEYAFTRRNTFGPLHRRSKRSFFCGPMSFRTTGSEYLKNGYSLIEQGMLKPLTFDIFEK